MSIEISAPSVTVNVPSVSLNGGGPQAFQNIGGPSASLNVGMQGTDVEVDFNREKPQKVETTHEEMKDFNEDWIEVRVQGKLPERRSNHTAWVSGSGMSEQ